MFSTYFQQFVQTARNGVPNALTFAPSRASLFSLEGSMTSPFLLISSRAIEASGEGLSNLPMSTTFIRPLDIRERQKERPLISTSVCLKVLHASSNGTPSL